MWGKYIYCIIAVREPKTFGSLGIGGRGDELYTVCFDDIAAVISNSPIINYSVSRENMLAHEKAIEEVMKEHTVLPVRFGTIAENEEKVKKILEKEYGKFKDLLNEIKDKKELGLKAIFKDNIYEEILNNYHNIRLFKERIAKKPMQATYYERIELGKMVEDALEKEKAIYKEKILTVLEPLSRDLKINNTYGEKMILNCAFLVETKKEEEFDQRITQFENSCGNRMNFKYVYTPPFNFVNLVIETGKY